jgi:hypothetical protein
MMCEYDSQGNFSCPQSIEEFTKKSSPPLTDVITFKEFNGNDKNFYCTNSSPTEDYTDVVTGKDVNKPGCNNNFIGRQQPIPFLDMYKSANNRLKVSKTINENDEHDFLLFKKRTDNELDIYFKGATIEFFTAGDSLDSVTIDDTLLYHAQFYFLCKKNKIFINKEPLYAYNRNTEENEQNKRRNIKNNIFIPVNTNYELRVVIKKSPPDTTSLKSDNTESIRTEHIPTHLLIKNTKNKNYEFGIYFRPTSFLN